MIIFMCKIATRKDAPPFPSTPIEAIFLVPQGQEANFMVAEEEERLLQMMGNAACVLIAFTNSVMRFKSIEVAKANLSAGLSASPMASAVKSVRFYLLLLSLPRIV